MSLFVGRNSHKISDKSSWQNVEKWSHVCEWARCITNTNQK